MDIEVDNISVISLNECSICFNSMIKTNSIEKLSCDHNFHSECINKWLINNNTCPLCRKVINKSEINIPIIFSEIIVVSNIEITNNNISSSDTGNIFIYTINFIENYILKCCTGFYMSLRLLLLFVLFSTTIFYGISQHKTIVDVYNFIDAMNTTSKNIVKEKSDIEQFELFTPISILIYNLYLFFHIILCLYLNKNFRDTILFAIMNGLYLININNINTILQFNDNEKYPNISDIYKDYTLSIYLMSIFYIIFNCQEYIIMFFTDSNVSRCVLCFIKSNN